jgi:cytochrome P450
MAVDLRFPTPSVSRLRGFMETSMMINNPLQTLEHHTHSFGSTYNYHFGGVRKVLVTSDPEILHHILVDRPDNYRKSVIQTEHMGAFLGEGLLTSHGAFWKRQRQLINQGFNQHSLESINGVMQESLLQSLEALHPALSQGPVDISAFLVSTTFAMAARSLFGAHISNAEIIEISRTISVIQAFMVRSIVQPYLRPWFRLSGEWSKMLKMRESGYAIMLRHIHARRASTVAGQDMLQILMNAVYEDTGKGMDDQQLLCECMQLLVAAHETSATALAWALYCLAQEPEITHTARQEFRNVLGDTSVNVKCVSQLPFNTHIMNEALRLYPPFWMVDRLSVDDDKSGDIEIKAGTTIIAFLYATHHSPKLWEDPERFHPARHASNSGNTSQRLIYLPFGAGPKRCVGSSYAILQMLMVMSELLRRFEFRLADNKPMEIQPMIILRPRGGIYMYMKPLH